MLEAVVLIILLLILIFIGYMCYYFLKENKDEILGKDVVPFFEKNTEKSVHYYTDTLFVKNNNVYVVIYELPLNSIYWSIGLFKDGKCKESLNFGKYQTTESGDVLMVFICNNKSVLKSAEEEVSEKYSKKYPYKKITHHTINYSDDFYLIFESYSNKFLKKPIIQIKKFEYSCNIQIEELHQNPILPKSLERFCERKDLFQKAKKEYIDDKCLLIPINIDTDENNIPNNCLTNRSDIINISDRNCEGPHFKLVAVDHFKSKAALHSNICFYNADDHKLFSVQITGEISEKICNSKTISTRRISFCVPNYIKKFYAIEYIYYDFVSGNKINRHTIIPMELYKLID